VGSGYSAVELAYASTQGLSPGCHTFFLPLKEHVQDGARGLILPDSTSHGENVGAAVFAQQ
jgi:hypothetical protein